MTTPNKLWIQTHTGKAWDFLNPNPASVDPRDIAHALAGICRYTGHTPFFYSVAQHCYYAAMHVARTYNLKLTHPVVQAAALHDASEAYCMDISAPLKKMMRIVAMNSQECGSPHYGDSPYDIIEAQTHEAIRQRFGISEEAWHDQRVKEADNRVYAAERLALFPTPAQAWSTGFEPTDVPIQKWANGSVAAEERYRWLLQDCGLYTPSA